MAAVLPFIQVAGAIVSAVGAIRQGQAAKAAANYNADIADQNAQVARDQTALAEQQQRRETLMRLGSVRAAQGHAGGDAGAGSVLDILGDVAAQSELERQQVVYEGELKARGYTNTANLDRLSGKTAQRAGYLKAGTELLGGGVDAYTTFTKFQRS